VSSTPDGNLFAPGDGWSDFHNRSRELAGAGDYKYVVIADISDYYNQISLHRVETALEGAGVEEERASSIEQFLMRIGGANQSQGIPVGPTASILHAEAVLNDIDTLLIKRGHVHARYVDDFRIFCKTRAEAYLALHELTEHLYTSHRLSLQPYKTTVLKVETFESREMLDPKEEEERKKKSNIQALLKELRVETGYRFTEDDLDASSENRALRKSLAELLDLCISKPPLHLGVARYTLRKARELRTTVILDTVLDNLERFAPAFRDTARYLQVVLTDKLAERHGSRVAEFANKNPMGRLPYMQNWLLWLFSERPSLLSATDAFALAEKSRLALGVRPLAMLMRAHGQVDWVRAQKETLAGLPPWERRAVILACSVLPKKERNATLSSIYEAEDVVDKAVARLACE
jgi:hypothetical protein